MTILRSLMLACLLFAGGAAAETLQMQAQDPAASAERPRRGGTMATVEARFGAPTTRHAAVGEPPITRWDYPRFSVFFEFDRVLHAVVVRDAAAG